MEDVIPVPFQFNPLKHHLSWIRNYVRMKQEKPDPSITSEIRHIGSSVMDVYTGNLTVTYICEEIRSILERDGLIDKEAFFHWTGGGFADFRMETVSDGSQWILKWHHDEKRYVHFFPARSSPLSFRIKANTLKSAILYIILTGKDFINEEDLNRARAMAALSPVKEISETEAISEMIEILRND